KQSDTTMAVLSALPFAPEHSPLSPETMERTKQAVHTVCHAEPERLFLHAEAHPNLGSLDGALRAMEQLVTEHHVVGWKVYTHLLGKLIGRLGDGNVLWGTDSIWYGSPQPQLEAFRAFTITEEYQERFGYPALTDEIKAKVLGKNGARVYGVTPTSSTCA